MCWRDRLKRGHEEFVAPECFAMVAPFVREVAAQKVWGGQGGRALDPVAEEGCLHVCIEVVSVGIEASRKNANT